MTYDRSNSASIMFFRYLTLNVYRNNILIDHYQYHHATVGILVIVKEADGVVILEKRCEALEEPSRFSARFREIRSLGRT
jgi:hypothetical protein